MLRMVEESSTTRTRLGIRTRIERSTSRRASSGRAGFAATASVVSGSTAKSGAASSTRNGGLGCARGRDHLRGRHVGDRAVDEDQIGAAAERLTGRGDAFACDDLDGHPCRRGRLPEHVVVVLRRGQQNCPQRQQLVGHALTP